MNVGFGLNLNVNASQQLVLTPQLKQAIKILQMSSVELQQEVQQQLELNPLLEEVENTENTENNENNENVENEIYDNTEKNNENLVENDPENIFEKDLVSELNENKFEIDVSNYNDDYFEESYYQNTKQFDDIDEEKKLDFLSYQNQNFTTLNDNLLDYLTLQVNTQENLSEIDKNLCLFIIYNLDENGFLTTDLLDLWQELPDDENYSFESLENAVKIVQTLEPIGIATKDYKECLILQAKRFFTQNQTNLLTALNYSKSDLDFVLNAIIEIINNHLALVAKKDFATIKKQLNLQLSQIKFIKQILSELNPKPCAEFTNFSKTEYIIPDVIVKENSIYINPEIYPKIQVNNYYASIIKQQKQQKQQKNNNDNLNEKLTEAKGFIKNIQQRFDTILKVSKSILNHQQDFFKFGLAKMKPLTLKEIADELNMHESTISRVVNQKYIQTPQGVFELKYFFSSFVNSTNDDGEIISALAIKAMIKDLVATENPKKPLSDNKIAELLNQKGVAVARRTVAKYREAIKIPTAGKRKIT